MLMLGQKLSFISFPEFKIENIYSNTTFFVLQHFFFFFFQISIWRVIGGLKKSPVTPS